ncbi:C40 family peptidase [Cellulomonas endophytica]|uniref:C40 family peptidase n=1 Tax=Cellulomonas endophytica TaxID=2494735 RepID=UPI001013001B|nr:C40 family peptidase [Cellulomonas endophytica]
MSTTPSTTAPSAARARHRAARRPSTPLTDLAAVTTGQIGVVSRRTAVVAASSGLVVSMLGATPAAAATPAEAGSLPASVDTHALTAAARAALAAAPVVTAPQEAAWTFDAPAVTAVAPPPPEPEPEPEPVVERAATASRSAERAAVAEPAAEPATEEVAVEAPAAEPAAAAPASGAGSSVVEIAAQYIGVPYVYGGTTPAGFDCSGFTSYVFRQLGVELPRTSSAQRGAGTVVSASEARAGDLIWSPGHISIYAGDGMQIDAPRPGKTIQLRSIWQSSPVFIRVL